MRRKEEGRSEGQERENVSKRKMQLMKGGKAKETKEIKLEDRIKRKKMK